MRGEPLLSLVFTGKEDDLEVGLTYFGKRYLIPALGTWASPDPLAVHVPGDADLNLYAYVHGRLLSATDPVGLDTMSQMRARDIGQALASAPASMMRQLNAWAREKQQAINRSAWSPEQEKAYQASKGVGPEPPGGKGLAGQIVDKTQHAAAGAWLGFAASLKAISAPSRSAPSGVPSVLERSKDTLSAVREAGTAMGAEGTFARVSNAAVARVVIDGQTRVYVGINVPSLGGDLATPKAVIEDWARANFVREGEEFAGVRMTSKHADVVVLDRIAKDARAAGVDPHTVTGELAAGTPVCNGCQAHAQETARGIKIVNPAPPVEGE